MAHSQQTPTDIQCTYIMHALSPLDERSLASIVWSALGSVKLSPEMCWAVVQSSLCSGRLKSLGHELVMKVTSFHQNIALTGLYPSY